MSKFTPWFPDTKVPLAKRRGVYETRFYSRAEWRTVVGYSYWFGDSWGSQEPNKELARKMAERFSVRRGIQQKEWRGLAKEPKK